MLWPCMKSKILNMSVNLSYINNDQCMYQRHAYEFVTYDISTCKVLLMPNLFQTYCAIY